MRVLSLNAWGGAVFGELAAWLPSVEADVVCLQEVTRTKGVSGWTTFEDAERTLPQRADLFDDIASLLPNHRAHFIASDAGPITDAGGKVRRQEFGIATFVSSRLTMLTERSTFVHGSFVEHDTWAIADRPRSMHAVRVRDDGGGRPATIAHLHGLRDPSGKGDTPACAEQARAIAGFVEEVRSAEDITVLCGDLNLLPDSTTFATLAEVDLTDLVGTTSTRTSLYPKPLQHANYLLLSDPAAAVRFEIVREPEVSDHRALILDL